MIHAAMIFSCLFFLFFPSASRVESACGAGKVIILTRGELGPKSKATQLDLFESIPALIFYILKEHSASATQTHTKKVSAFHQLYEVLCHGPKVH
jgi:hypothetical protein